MTATRAVGLSVAAFALGWILHGLVDGLAREGSPQTPEDAAPSGEARAGAGSAAPPPAGVAAFADRSPRDAVAPVPALSTSPGHSEDLRPRIARLAAAELGDPLPADALDEAVRQAAASIAGTPGAYAHQAAVRESLRRRLGDLGDPWEIVVEARASDQVRFDLDDMGVPNRSSALSATALDVDRPVSRRSPEDALFVRGGLPPLGRAMLLESIVIQGDFGPPEDGSGSVSLDVGGSLPDVRGQGATTVRLAGERVENTYGQLPRWRVTVRQAAARVTFRGRLVAPRSSSPRDFRVVTAESEAPVLSLPVTLQVAVPHVGGNPCTIRLDGTIGDHARSVSGQPVYDEVATKKSMEGTRDAAAWARAAGWVPAGKALRVRRVDWRARFADPLSDHSELTVTVGGHELVSIRRLKDLFPGSPVDRAAMERARRKEKDPAPEFRSGSWAGEILVRAGEETNTKLTAAYFTLAEAVLYGDVVDDPGR